MMKVRLVCDLTLVWVMCVRTYGYGESRNRDMALGEGRCTVQGFSSLLPHPQLQAKCRKHPQRLQSWGTQKTHSPGALPQATIHGSFRCSSKEIIVGFETQSPEHGNRVVRQWASKPGDSVGQDTQGYRACSVCEASSPREARLL